MAMENIDYIKSIDGAERRFYDTELLLDEKEENQVKTRTISGYAAVFDKDSQDFGGWVERIDKRAFDDVLDDDVFALFNHDPNQVLARNKAGLKLSIDEHGRSEEHTSELQSREKIVCSLLLEKKKI